MNLRSIRKLFARSPDTHRSVLFWHWPTALPPKTVEREMDEILANGIGGVLIDSPPSSHAADYLNEEWLTALSAATSRARKRHDSVWIYDDLASKNSPAKTKQQKLHPEHASSYLKYDTLRATNATLQQFILDPPYAVFIHEDEGYRQIDEAEWGTLADSNATLLCFHHRRSEIHLRYLHADAVRNYLDETYGPIQQKTKRFFGNTLGVILANNAELPSGRDILPWDDDLPDLFERAYGYPLISELPFLITERTESPTLTFQFWNLIADLFREGFSHTLQSWGEENRIPICGYFQMRGTWTEPVYETGPRMPLYALQMYPAIWLSDSKGHIDIVEQKQACSTQRQFDTRGVIGVYERPAHETTIEYLRGIAYEDLALGATYRTFDGVHNRARLDHTFVANFTPGDTAWPWMGTHHDRLARLTWLQGLGKSRCEVLLIHPESSIQATNPTDGKWQSLYSHLRSIAEGLLRNHIDFDFGSEYLLGLHAQASHDRIEIKDSSYSIVVMPPMINLRSQTYALLQDFTMSGGHLLSVGTVPYLLDGELKPEIAEFFEQYAVRLTNGIDLFEYSAISSIVKDWDAENASIPDTETGPRFLVTRREWENLEFIHISKTSGTNFSPLINFTVQTEGHIEFWNHIDGTMTPICPCTPDEPVVIEDTWQALEARTYVAIPEPMPEGFEPEAPLTIERTLEPQWTATREHGIPRMLDTCRFAGHAWGDIEDARNNLRERVNANPEGIIGHLQWILDDDTFDADLDHELVLIAPDNATLTLNHELLESIPAPAINLPGFTGFTLPTQPGTLQIEGKFRHAELLSAPIIIPKAKRDSESGEIDAIPVQLTPWNQQDLEGFAHTVTYQTEIQGYERFDDAPIYLECESLNSPAEVRINSQVVGHLIWQPYRLDIRPWWTAGPLDIEIEVAGTWANVFHPQKRLLSQGLDAPPKIVVHAHTSAD